MAVRWKSEDGRTEVILSDVGTDGDRKGTVYLTVLVPDESSVITRYRIDSRSEYITEVAQKLRALTDKVFGAGTEQRMVLINWYDSFFGRTFPLDAVIVQREWRQTQRQLFFRFFGKLSPDFTAETADWQDMMPQKLLEGAT